MPRKSPIFDAVMDECQSKVYGLDDVDLIAALVMFHSADEPLRTSLGLRAQIDTDMVLGFRDAVTRYGGLTWKQRKVARRMVKYGMVHLELSARLNALRVRFRTEEKA